MLRVPYGFPTWEFLNDALGIPAGIYGAHDTHPIALHMRLYSVGAPAGQRDETYPCKHSCPKYPKSFAHVGRNDIRIGIGGSFLSIYW